MMNGKDKWKTYPCRECVLKGKCRERCFTFPSFKIIHSYTKRNDIRNICLSCGEYTNPPYGYTIMNRCKTICPICHPVEVNNHV